MEDRTVKQQFLRSEIISKGYNPDEFVSFLDLNRSGDFDIDNITLEELKKYVSEFITSNPTKSSEILLNNYPKSVDENFSVMSKVIEEEKPIIEEIPIIKSNSLPERENKDKYYEVIKCVKHQMTVFSTFTTLVITVSKPEKHKGGIFSSDYVTYLISVENCFTKVRRRYSDFEWLREKLSLLFPHFMIPPIPNKSSSDRFSDKVLNKRMKSFEKFLDSLSKNVHIKDSQIFYDFLQVEDNLFQNKKKEYDIIRPHNSLSEIKSTNGELIIKLDKEYDKLLEGVKYFLGNETVLLKKLKILLKLLASELTNITNRLNEVYDIYTSLEKLSEHSFNNDVVKDTYNLLGKNMKIWKESVENQIGVIENDYMDFFKYIRKEYVTFQGTICKVENVRNDYLKAERNLIHKKENLFRTQNTNKWELSPEEFKKPLSHLLSNKELAFTKMCYKDNKNLLNLKRNYSFYSTYLFEEYERIRNLNGERYTLNFLNSSRKQIKNFINLNECMNEIVSFYSSLK